MPISKRLKPSQVSSLGHPETYVPPQNPWGGDERRKSEKLRISAKQRREQETEHVNNLASTLPFPPDATSKLDRASVLRLVISYLRIKKYAEEQNDLTTSRPNRVEQFDHDTQIIPHQPLESGAGIGESELMLDILNGFVIYISVKATIVYVSQNVDQHLGLAQVDMIGRSVHHYIHPDDQGELMKQLIIKTFEDYEIDDVACGMPGTELIDCDKRFFYVRMKCFYLRKGVKSRQPGFMLVQWSGSLKSDRNGENEGLVCICRPLQPTPILEIRMDGNMFMSRHSMDLKFTFCDPRVSTLIGYEPNEIVGKTAYTFHNPVDAHVCRSCHSDLMVKGSSMSKYYRFLAKSGKWVWMQTRATVIYNTHNEPQYVVCMNYIVGEQEGKRCMEDEDRRNSHSLKHSDGSYPLDSCSHPAYIDDIHVSDSHSSSSSYIDNSTDNSPYSVFDGCSDNSGDCELWETSLKKQKTSQQGNNPCFNSGNISLSSEMLDPDCQMPEDIINSLDIGTNQRDAGEVRIIVHSLDGSESLVQEQHSTGRLNHNVSDITMQYCNQLIDDSAEQLFQEFSAVHLNKPGDVIEIGDDCSPAPSCGSSQSWTDQIPKFGHVSGTAKQLEPDVQQLPKRQSYTSLRSLLSKTQPAGLNELNLDYGGGIASHKSTGQFPMSYTTELQGVPKQARLPDVGQNLTDEIVRQLQSNVDGAVPKGVKKTKSGYPQQQAIGLNTWSYTSANNLSPLHSTSHNVDPDTNVLSLTPDESNDCLNDLDLGMDFNLNDDQQLDPTLLSSFIDGMSLQGSDLEALMADSQRNLNAQPSSDFLNISQIGKGQSLQEGLNSVSSLNVGNVNVPSIHNFMNNSEELTKISSPNNEKPKKTISRLEQILTEGKTQQCTNKVQQDNMHSAKRTTGAGHESSTKSNTTLLENLLRGNVKPTEAHRVITNPDAPTYLSKRTLNTPTLPPVVPNEMHQTLSNSSAGCSFLRTTNPQDPSSPGILPLSAGAASVMNQPVQEDDLSLYIPECEDWKSILGPLSPRSRALMEEADAILLEVERQDSEAQQYWNDMQF